jgi:hypothetical protein
MRYYCHYAICYHLWTHLLALLVNSWYQTNSNCNLTSCCHRHIWHLPMRAPPSIQQWSRMPVVINVRCTYMEIPNKFRKTICLGSNNIPPIYNSMPNLLALLTNSWHWWSAKSMEVVTLWHALSVYICHSVMKMLFANESSSISI